MKNLIGVNLEKTKCMVFNKTGRLIRRTFCFGKTKLDVTREYKYLGSVITPSINLSTGLADLKDRGLRALGAIKTKSGMLFRKHIPTTIHLIHSLVKPILTYASDFWGCLKLPKNNPIENLHIRFCKGLLGIQRQTPNLGVLLELGRIPLNIYAKKNFTKNWERIALKRKANAIILYSYAYNHNGWARSMKDYLSGIRLKNIFLNIRTGKLPNAEVFCRERDIFYQTSFRNIQINISKLRTFAHLKTEICLEKYLTSVQNISDRIAITKFRLSNHCLVIEKGRHLNLNICDHSCPFCPSHIENEFHFLIKCPIYSHLRVKLFEGIQKVIIDFYYPENEYFLFWFLLKTRLL